MADATYDIVIVGGESEGLIVATCLTKYSRTKACLFVNRHLKTRILSPGKLYR